MPQLRCSRDTCYFGAINITQLRCSRDTCNYDAINIAQLRCSRKSGIIRYGFTGQSRRDGILIGNDEFCVLNAVGMKY